MGWQLFRDRDHGAVDRGDDPAQTDPDADEIFWASPVGRAARARMRGDRYFQIELDDATIASYAEATTHEGGGRRARRTCDLLGQIEELGWRLEHVSWWRVDGNDPFTNGATPGRDPGADHVKGVYLFHSAPGSDEDVSPAPGPTHSLVHPPAHRRDVL
jgi:hypothetical protein